MKLDNIHQLIEKENKIRSEFAIKLEEKLQENELSVYLFQVVLTEDTKDYDVKSIIQDVLMSVRQELQDIDIQVRDVKKEEKGVTVKLALAMQKPGFDSALKFAKPRKTMETPYILGMNDKEKPVVMDMAKSNVMLIGGMTGSGKTTQLYQIVLSLLELNGIDALDFVFVDCKIVELNVFSKMRNRVFPNIQSPIVGVAALEWLVDEMVRRYNLFSDAKVLNINDYNKKEEKPMKKLVMVIDEYADLMLTNAEKVEDSILRLAQMSKNAGIYLILATQRPSVEVITGLIKANLFGAMSFKVATAKDSRQIISFNGAEEIEEDGTFLYIDHSLDEPERYEGYLVEEEVAEKIVKNYLSDNEEEPTIDCLMKYIPRKVKRDMPFDGDDDPLFDEVVSHFTPKGKISISAIQRYFRIGYNRSSRIMDRLEKEGIVGPAKGIKSREIYGYKDQ